jgi:putative oxidoreductase
MDAGLLVLRLVLGLIFLAHGSQKLFGWLGGKGLAGQVAMLEKIGVRPAGFFALVSSAGEFFGGLGAALGLLTPLAAAGILGSMLVALIKVQAPRGFWNSQGGIEWPLALAAMAMSLGLTGPGAYSLDFVLHLRLPQPLTDLIILAGLAIVVLSAVARPAHPRPSASEGQAGRR